MTSADNSSPNFLRCLRRELDTLNLSGSHLLVGFSGGADSTSLLHGLQRLREECQLQITAAHLDHRARAAESAADAAWAEQFVQQIHVPIVIEKWQHERESTASGFEEAARQARYKFFRQTANRLDCEYVAVAHTADDQAETILHHILRGTGLAGLKGIPAARQLESGLHLIRPLLTISREIVLKYLQDEKVEYRTDATNADTHWTRNRIRHSLLPILQEQFNPGVKQALLRLGQQADEVQQALQFWTKQILADVLLDQQPNVVRLQLDKLNDYPTHMIRESLKQIWAGQHWPRQRMGYDKWSEIAEMAANPHAPDELHLPGGCIANRRGNLLVLRMRD